MNWRGLLLAAAAGSWAAAGPAGASAEAGASSFAGARRLYRAPDPSTLPVAVPPVHLEEAPHPPEPGPEATELHFPVERFEVVGNTLLSASEVDRALAPFRGEDKRLADVESARDALQKAYDAAGFVTVAVVLPQQSITGGVVSLKVVEARLGQVEVKNDGVRWFDDASVRRDTPHLQPGAMLRESDLAEDMQAANANSDRRVRPILRAGAQEGSVDLDLVVDDRPPIHGGFEMTNERTPASPDTRARATLAYGNLWGLEHVISGSFEFVPGADFSAVQVWTATYSAPMPWKGGQSAFGYVVHSATTSGIVGSSGLNALGNGLTAGIRYDIPLPEPSAFEGYTHSLVLAVDRKDVTNTLQATGGASAETPITYLPFGLAYNATRAGEQMLTSFRLGATFNVAGTLNGGSERDFQMNRGGVVPGTSVTGTFAILNAELTETLRLPALLRQIAAGRPLDFGTPERATSDDWLVELRVNGQWASQPQIATEQCAAGGPYTVRGYLIAERFGDDCIVGRTELQAPTLHLPGWIPQASLRPYAFLDYARLWVLSDPASPASHSRLGSYGLGLRAELFNHLNADFYVAKPRNSTDSTTTSPDLRFRVWAGF